MVFWPPLLCIVERGTRGCTHFQNLHILFAQSINAEKIEASQHLGYLMLLLRPNMALVQNNQCIFGIGQSSIEVILAIFCVQAATMIYTALEGL